MIAGARKAWRRLLLRQLSRMTAEDLRRAGEARLLATFRRASGRSSGYAKLLAEAGVDPGAIRSAADFVASAPVLDKRSTFSRFGLDELCQRGALERIAGVLTSSGHGGQFAFGLSTWSQARRSPALIDLGLEQSFGVDRRRTLVINCLPMGVRFQSRAVAIADVSVREDMALALAAKFGPRFEQLILVIDPLFGKRLLDHGDETGFDWRAHRVHVIVGEEPFGERFRDYVAARLGVDLDDAGGGLIASSMGVAELGLNLFFETRDTIAMRRALDRDEAARQALFGASPFATPAPGVFAYNPLRSFVEVLDPDASGLGELVVSQLDKDAPLPLLRYRTGDVARLLGDDEADRLRRASAAGPLAPAPMPFPLIAIAGRRKDLLPNGRSVLRYRDALYRDPRLASSLSGALRLQWDEAAAGNAAAARTTVRSPDKTAATASGEALEETFAKAPEEATGGSPGEALRAQVQLRRGVEPDPAIESALAQALRASGAPASVQCWRFAEFPFGMNLDYERKFSYYVP
ncbi:MAG: hypothetical protein KJZ83_00660 [Burkholderiaceae bacterium]|nr:hypothetical protein [Burkholderiaceae bacterium]